MKKETIVRLVSVINFLLFILCLLTGSGALLIFTALFTGARVFAHYALAGMESRSGR